MTRIFLDVFIIIVAFIELKILNFQIHIIVVNNNITWPEQL